MLWIPLSIALFAALPPATAGAIVLVGGFLLLPERIGLDVPVLPPLGKHEISVFGALVGMLVFARGRLLAARPGRGWDLLWIAMLVGCVLTGFANRDAIAVGGSLRPAMSPYDGLSLGVTEAIVFGLPFLLGRALFRSTRDAWALVAVLVVALLAYSPLMLWEVRMSPQLHNTLYGFHPHDFGQNYRWAGWRPQVLTRHPLDLARFAACAALATLAFARTRRRVLGLPATPLFGYLAGVVVLCKSLAPILYLSVSAPILFLVRPSRVAAIATILVIGASVYPAARWIGVFPTEPVVALIGTAAEERAESLAFRLRNEDVLLAHARARPLLGWGTWGRNRVYDEAGDDASVTDGLWIVMLGRQGLVGLFTCYAMLVVPVVYAGRRLRRLPQPGQRGLVGLLALAVGLIAVDLLPNSSLPPYTVALSGALLGLARTPAPAPAPEPEKQRIPRAVGAAAPGLAGTSPLPPRGA